MELRPHTTCHHGRPHPGPSSASIRRHLSGAPALDVSLIAARLGKRDCNFMAVVEDMFGGSVVGIEIRLLGRFAVRLDGEEIPPGAFGGRLARAPVPALLTRPGSVL